MKMVNNKLLTVFLMIALGFLFFVLEQPCLGMKNGGTQKSIYLPSLRFCVARKLAKDIRKGERSKKILNTLPAELSNFVELLIKSCGNHFNALRSIILQPTLYSCHDMRDLLCAGINLNGIDKDDKTLLMLAIDKRSVERAQLLLDYGAHIDQKNHRKLTPIFYAIDKFNYPEMVTFFLKNGADIHQVKYGDLQKNVTLLIQAIEQNNRCEVIKTLIKYGADVNMPSYAITPLSCSAKKRSTTVINLLLKHGADIKGINPLYKGNALHMAARFDSVEGVKRLLQEGIPIDSVDGWGETALMETARRNAYAVASLLLERGANRFLVNNRNKTAHDIALQEEDFLMVNLLKR